MDDGPPSTAYVGIEAHASGRFWLAIVLAGLGTGASAAALTLILQFVQHLMWPDAGATLLDAASEATPWRHILVLLGAGLLTGAGQIILVRLTSGNSIDITAAIWFSAGRLPALRTLGSAVLSVIIVNDLVKHRPYSWVVGLCAVYASTVLVQGGIKLVLNIYRGWVGERAKRDLRRRVHTVIENPA